MVSSILAPETLAGRTRMGFTREAVLLVSLQQEEAEDAAGLERHADAV